MRRRLMPILLWTFAIGCASSMFARAEERPDAGARDQVVVADAFLDLRTGPGRGYPVFHIAERGEHLAILMRRTDWFKVRTEKGKTGWVSREQMERTLTLAGVRKTFRDVLVEDFMRRRFEASFSAGGVRGDGIAGMDTGLTTTVGYRVNENVSAELSLAQVSDDFFSARFTILSVVSTPFPHWSFAPTLSIGFGSAVIEPKATLIDVPRVDTEMASAGIGVRRYFARRFFLRADYKVHRVFVDDADRADVFTEWSAGVGFFF